MALSDYLANKYLTADSSSKTKKRKRKNAEQSGFTIADDEGDSLRKSSSRYDEDDDDAPMIVPGSGTVSTKKTTWKTIGVAAPTNSEQEAADAILASAAEERKSRAQADDDAPTLVGSNGIADEDPDYGLDDNDGPKMASGALAGLQSAEQVTAALRRRELEEKAAMEEAGLDAGGKAQETIYRDASGKIINVAMKRAELRRKAEEEERKKLEELEGRKGDVQRREQEERKRELENAKLLKVSRFADDEELNAELKDRSRWNDPAAQFLNSKTKSASAVSTGGKAASGKKLYMGASEPNRYGIKPGYRWDGVDRSNGFERRWFDARNKQTSNKEAEYAWQMDE